MLNYGGSKKGFAQRDVDSLLWLPFLTLWILKVHQINAVFNPKISFFLAAMALNES